MNEQQKDQVARRDTLDVPTVRVSGHYARPFDPHDSPTAPEVPIPESRLIAEVDTDKLGIVDPFIAENKLLASGTKHVFVKIGHVMLKVRSIHINQNDHQFLTLMIDDERDDVWVNVPWWFRFESCYGKKQKFIW